MKIRITVICVFVFLIWCSLCLLLICQASGEFVLTQTLLCCVLLSFFLFFGRNLSSSSSLVLFFFFFFPYKPLCSRSEIIRSPSDICFSSRFFISSRFDHNFILVYWPKFTGKAKTKRNSLNLKNQS